MAKGKDPRPPNTRWLTPYLVVSDMEKAMSLYKKAFGFKASVTLPGPDGGLMHAEMTYRGKPVVMMMPAGAWGSSAKPPKAGGYESPVSLYLYCEDVDEMCEKAREAGASVLREPEDMFWGDRTCSIADSDGYSWSFATNFGEFDPSKLPF